MPILLRRCFLFCLLWLGFVHVALASQFTVKKIIIQGNQRVSRSAILKLLPLRAGQVMRTEQSGDVIRALFDAGYFSDVKLSKKGGHLIVSVKELPVITRLIITGNKKIDNKKLEPVLKQLNITVGQVYRPGKINELKSGLVSAYRGMGREQVSIDVKVEQGENSTVVLEIVVSEGVATKIHAIDFSGNNAFSAYRLRHQVTARASGLLTLFSSSDLYSEERLFMDKQALQDFYYDHGYLDVKINQTIERLPDGHHVNVHFTVDEGPVYRISGYRLSGGGADHNAAIKQLVNLSAGEVFSKAKIIKINQKIVAYFKNQAYAFAEVNLEPRLDRQAQTVFVVLSVKTGHQVNVRFISTGGNVRTTDKILRYQMRQLEAAPYHLDQINESRRRIANLPYFKDIQVQPIPVEGDPNQVDLHYTVTEDRAGRATIQGGYSGADGFLYGVNLVEPNFLGSGRFVSLGFQSSRFSSQYSGAYINPFYTYFGMTRGWHFHYTKTTPSQVSLDTYNMHSYGGSLDYTLPLSDYDTLGYGVSLDHVVIANVNPETSSPAVYDFLQRYPSPFNNVAIDLSLTHATLDRAIFPMHGNFQKVTLNVGLPVFSDSLTYYKTSYKASWYYQLGTSDFVIHPHFLVGYGAGYGKIDTLPFFLNFYGGGLETLPGYEDNSLGPQNPNNPGASIGGNVEIFGGLNLVVPNGISDTLRTALTVDFGNIFQTVHVLGNPGNPAKPGITYEEVALKNIRWSAGLVASWRSPFGLISFGYSLPFNVRGARVSQFGFNFGTSL